jgi:hypothetical protein
MTPGATDIDHVNSRGGFGVPRTPRSDGGVRHVSREIHRAGERAGELLMRASVSLEAALQFISESRRSNCIARGHRMRHHGGFCAFQQKRDCARRTRSRSSGGRALALRMAAL